MRLVPTRRHLLQLAALGIAAAPTYGFVPALAATGDGSPLASRNLFFRDPDRSSVRLSPDGRNIAWREPHDGVLNLVAAPVENVSQSRQITHAKDRSAGGFFIWAWTNKHIVFFDTVGDENYRAYSVDIDTGATVALTPPDGVRSYVQQRARRFPNEMLFGINARDRKLFDIVRVDITTGQSQLSFQNPGFERLYTATDFAVHFARRFLPNGSAEVLTWASNGNWTTFMDIPAEDAFTTWLAGISADLRSAFLIDSRGRNTSALIEIDIATRESRVLAEDPEVDIVAAVDDPSTNRPYAAVSIADRKRWHLIDPAYAFDLDHMRAAQGVGEMAIESESNEQGRIVVLYYRSDAAGEFRIYHRAKQSFVPLFKTRSDLDVVALRPMASVVIRARDGVQLPGYLTLPTSAASGGPLVLLVHGGPYARDFWGFQETHQWLANRGYAVLSVNYRGSTGFGKHFVNIADQGWGESMQDDLTDAAAWAVAQGHADPARIGFFGASYGGYAALTAATKTPETFNCIIDLFGPSNLVTEMQNKPCKDETSP